LQRREREAPGAIPQVGAGRGARLETLLKSERDRNRAQELARRSGWAWLGAYRRYDQYKAGRGQDLVT
jgi:hypothetical protein